MRALAVAGVLFAVGSAIPLPDPISTIESRDDFRMRTRKVFSNPGRHHKSFQGAEFTGSEELTVEAAVYYDAATGKYVLDDRAAGGPEWAQNNVARAVFVNAVCVVHSQLPPAPPQE